MLLFTETEKQKYQTTLKFRWNQKNPQIVKEILRGDKKGFWRGEVSILDLNIYYRATVIKILWYWLKSRCVDQWNKTADPQHEHI